MKRAMVLPKLSTSLNEVDSYSAMADAGSTFKIVPGHSRTSSASSVTSPLTPTFSTRHTRWPSSSSSLATTPDSPANVAKSALGDLVEDPAERDDVSEYDEAESTAEEPLCICDSPCCEHRQPCTSPSSTLPPGSPEWIARDDSISDDSFAAARSLRHRNSVETFGEKMTQRVHRRWPSISKRWRERKATTSISSSVVRSAPPSRSSSMRQSSLRESLATHLERREATYPFASQSESCSRNSSISWPTDSVPPFDLSASKDIDTSFDGPERPPTPLLPPIMAELQSPTEVETQSPLQSPTVVSHCADDSVCNSPLASPLFSGLPTPPLSSKPSLASVNMARPGHFRYSGETNPMEASEEPDFWSNRLGHANFHISPEPYVPTTCDTRSCNQLLEDWETARKEYMRQAAQVSEHYGPTSRTYKLTEEKWAEIDGKWKTNLQKANEEAEARGEMPAKQALAKTQHLAQMPSLVDPQHPDKFLKISEADIVGPMVQYSKSQQMEQPKPPKKHPLLRLFTGPASLLTGRPSHASR